MCWRWAGHGDDRRAPQLSSRRTRRERLFVVLVALVCLIPNIGPRKAVSPTSHDVRESVPRGPWPAPAQGQIGSSLTGDGIPFYTGRPPCTLADADTIAHEFAIKGADVATQQWAVYIASREGGCSFEAVTVNTASRDNSHCTFQLNARTGMFGPSGALGRLGWTPESVRQSMRACAAAASDLWAACGRGPWSPPYSCRAPDISSGVDPSRPQS